MLLSIYSVLIMGTSSPNSGMKNETGMSNHTFCRFCKLECALGIAGGSKKVSNMWGIRAGEEGYILLPMWKLW